MQNLKLVQRFLVSIDGIAMKTPKYSYFYYNFMTSVIFDPGNETPGRKLC